MAEHNETGKWGEDVAAEYLMQQGFRIIERNWQAGHKEIDIIATNGSLLLFVEVKTRRNNTYGNPYEAVDWRKCRNLLAAMQRYLAMHHVDMETRFDVLSITGTPQYHTIEQLENAVSDLIY